MQPQLQSPETSPQALTTLPSSGTSQLEPSCSLLPNQHQQQLPQAAVPLTIDERACVSALKQKWEARKSTSKARFNDDWYLRFARCSPGSPFNFFSAWKVMMSFPPRYLDLSILGVEEMIKNKVMFPVKGLQSVAGYNSECCLCGVSCPPSFAC